MVSALKLGIVGDESPVSSPVSVRLNRAWRMISLDDSSIFFSLIRDRYKWVRSSLSPASRIKWYELKVRRENVLTRKAKVARTVPKRITPCTVSSCTPIAFPSSQVSNNMVKQISPATRAIINPPPHRLPWVSYFSAASCQYFTDGEYRRSSSYLSF